MPPVTISLKGNLLPLTGKGSQQLNRILKNEILPIVMKQVTVDVLAKSLDYSQGVDMPAQKVPRQAQHAVGQSDSGYSSTGKLSDNIKVSFSSKINSLIESLSDYASWVEFGTGIFGPRGEPIVPKKSKVLSFIYKGRRIATKFTLGQPPNPVMRGSVWYIKDNIRETIIKIQKTVWSKYG
jgi:hypothetical protein